MPLPENVRSQVEPIVADYCAKRVPEHVRHRIRMAFTIRGNAVTVIQERPHWQNHELWIKSAIAQFRYNQKSGKWTLYCADRNSRWHDYMVKSERDIRVLLREVDDDPTGIFWG